MSKPLTVVSRVDTAVMTYMGTSVGTAVYKVEGNNRTEAITCSIEETLEDLIQRIGFEGTVVGRHTTLKEMESTEVLDIFKFNSKGGL